MKKLIFSGLFHLLVKNTHLGKNSKESPPPLSLIQSSWNQVKIIIQRNQCRLIYTYVCLSKVLAFFIIIDPPAIIMERCFAQCSEFSSCQRGVGWTSVGGERITFDRRLEVANGGCTNTNFFLRNPIWQQRNVTLKLNPTCDPNTNFHIVKVYI